MEHELSEQWEKTPRVKGKSCILGRSVQLQGRATWKRVESGASHLGGNCYSPDGTKEEKGVIQKGRRGGDVRANSSRMSRWKQREAERVLWAHVWNMFQR